MTATPWQEQIQHIFNTEKIPELSQQNLLVYRDHLQSSLEHPCFLFAAAEDGAPFEAVLLEALLQEVDEHEGLYAQVKRTSDDRVFTLPLAHLECPQDDPANHDLVDTYCTWFLRSTFGSLWHE